MAEITLTDIALAEAGDHFFIVSWMYQSHNLKTGPLSRTSTMQEVKEAIVQVMASWLVARADNNFQLLKDTYEGESITIQV